MIEEHDIPATVAVPRTGAGLRGAWRFTRASWLNTVAVALVLLAVLAAVIGPLVVRHSPNAADFAAILQPPSRAHLMGTDNVGRDILARVVAGARISMVSAVLIILLAAPFGCLLGIVGYLVNVCFVAVERRTLAWHRGWRASILDAG